MLGKRLVTLGFWLDPNRAIDQNFVWSEGGPPVPRPKPNHHARPEPSRLHIIAYYLTTNSYIVPVST